jgi:hypothetical protein
MTMVWATVAEVREVFSVQAIALGAAEWPALPENDAAVQALINNATSALTVKAIRWPILTDDDRPEDTEQAGHVVAAVCEVIRDRLVSRDAVVAVGGMGSAQIIASGGRVKAGNLEVQGGSSGGGAWLASRSRVPVDAIFALQNAGMIGGSVTSC